MSTASRPLDPGERTGVLEPGNLRRYATRRWEPSEGIRSLVENFWQVTWALSDGVAVEQRILATPLVNLTVETGTPAGPLVATGVYRTAWVRTIDGSGSAFGIRLQPAGLGLLSALGPDDLADATVPVTARLDAGLYEFLAAVAAAPDRVAAATDLLERTLHASPLPDTGLLANAAVAAIRSQALPLSGAELAMRLGVTERTVQRALRATVGRGPAWIGRWTRLQEVAAALAARPRPDMAALAARFGYADQSHLINDFRTAVGVTPGEYARSVGP
jgi:AraC-like DNA-binding protein